MNTKHKEIVVVVHDAGGAEVIGAYILTRRGKEHFHAYGAGPAARVFKRLGLPLQLIKDDPAIIAGVMNRHRGAAYALIAAPGWMTKIEIRALTAAKKTGLKTTVYMDSWADERRRFGYPKKGWQKNEPDQFWVGDRYALANIKRQFPHIPVRLVRNQYFARVVAQFKVLKRSAPKPGAILFTSTIGSGSHALLTELLLSLAGTDDQTVLRIRYHPGDKRDRYDALIKRFKNTVHVEKSNEKDIVKDLIRARVVVGIETTAMAVAALCGIRTISFVTRDADKILPFPFIQHARTAGDAVKEAVSAALVR